MKTRKLSCIAENLGAASVSLFDGEMVAIENGFSQINVQGARLPDAILALSYI
jgi:hypothetical protein